MVINGPGWMISEQLRDKIPYLKSVMPCEYFESFDAKTTKKTLDALKTWSTQQFHGEQRHVILLLGDTHFGRYDQLRWHDGTIFHIAYSSPVSQSVNPQYVHILNFNRIAERMALNGVNTAQMFILNSTDQKNTGRLIVNKNELSIHLRCGIGTECFHPYLLPS